MHWFTRVFTLWSYVLQFAICAKYCHFGIGKNWMYAVCFWPRSTAQHAAVIRGSVSVYSFTPNAPPCLMKPPPICKYNILPYINNAKKVIVCWYIDIVCSISWHIRYLSNLNQKYRANWVSFNKKKFFRCHVLYYQGFWVRTLKIT